MRLLGYLWALPVTLVGVGLALLAWSTGGAVGVREGIIEATGGLVAWFLRGGRLHQGGAAMALGHVILARDADALAHSRTHELVHVRQFERWGVFFLPAYWLVAAWLWASGLDPYLDHPFEPPPE